MKARPYILGCLCLVGANGTAVASDVDLTGGLLSMSGPVGSSSFEGAGSRASQGGHDNGGGDVSSHPIHGVAGSTSRPPAPSPADADDDLHGGASSSQSNAPNWQSLLPGSIF